MVDLELVAAETRRSLRERKFDPDANDLSMRGWALINQPQNRETTQAALEQFEAALARDPGAVEALVGLAFAHMRNVANRWSDQAAIELQKAETAIGQALARDPRHATAHMVRGIAYRAQFRYEEAVASLNTAIDRKSTRLNSSH